MMRFIATRFIYACVMYLAQPLLRHKLRRRARAEALYGEAVQERFGYYNSAPSQDSQDNAPAQEGHTPYLWVHAVSLGETRAAAVLIARLRQLLPGMRLLLTHGTATGRTQGLSLLQPGDVQVWQPWDTPGAVQRFLAHFQPRIGILIETEVWPNWVAGCAQAGVPLCLVNARLSAQSLRKAQRLAWLARPAFGGLRAVWAQSADDAARLLHIGAPVQAVMGNLKYDATPDAAQLEQGRAWRRAPPSRPIVMFASSREGEELLLIKKILQEKAAALDKICDIAAKNIAIDSVQWLIVPRHPQRFDAVSALCQAHGLSVSRRSAWGAAPEVADIWLGDSLGEMALYFGLADVALLGGSFAPLGGQNLIEAAACGCAVVMGPHTFNFADAATLAEAAGAAFTQPDLAQAVDYALALVHSPHRLAQARQSALQLSTAHRGAAQATAQALCKLLPHAPFKARATG